MGKTAHNLSDYRVSDYRWGKHQSVMSAVEIPNYVVIASDNQIEIRQYPSIIQAAVIVDGPVNKRLAQASVCWQIIFLVITARNEILP